MTGGVLKAFALLIFLAAIAISFQNCGASTRSADMLGQSNIALNSNNCDSQGTCTSSADYLWMRIREYEPYRIEHSTLNVGHFNVGGQCGIGDFNVHSFVWELREAFGNQSVVGQGSIDNRCANGQFAVPVILNQVALVQPDQRYTLYLELVGVTDTNQEVSNPMPNSQGTLDIIFTSTPPN